MADSTPDRSWIIAVATRAAVAGAALGAISVAASTFVLAGTGAGALNVTVALATTLLALTIGLWAGAPDASKQELPVRERWLAAAAVTAAAGAFTTFSALYQQLFPGPWWRVAGLLIVLGFPVYLIGLLLPTLLTWAERWLDREEEDRRPWGALGPILIGALGAATFGALLAGLFLLPTMSPGSVLMVFAILHLIPTVLGDPASVPPSEAELYSVVTPYGSLQVTEVRFPGERQPERRLYLNGEEESGQLVRSGSPTLAYIAAAESWLSEITPSGATYLFLGGGAYTLPRRIVERDSRARVTVVELDPEVTRIAHRFFGLRSQHRIRAVHGDARAYLDQAGPKSFDRIYVDVYGGQEALPHSMVTREAAASLAERLAPGGIAAVNLIGDVVGEEQRQVWSVVRSFADVFPTVVVYTHLGRDFPDRQNFLVALSSDAAQKLPKAAGHFEEWPRDEWPPMEGTTIFTDLEPTDEERSITPRPSAREAS